jgi:Fic family protein
MRWNWQSQNWPHFSFESEKIQAFLEDFFKFSGLLLGAYKHIEKSDKDNLVLEIITDEAIKTSQIEGEYLNRESVQSSIKMQFGLQVDGKRPSAAEHGIAEMMVDLYKTFEEPLSNEMIFRWHVMLTNGRRDLMDIGSYRSSNEPMQVVSGHLGRPVVHFEAPPSAIVQKEMDRFLDWYQATSKTGKMPLHPVVRAGLAHLYFVSIHPLEDGNGRIGRAIAKKALSEGLGYPSLISLSHTIEKYKKKYYDALAKNNQSTEITDWLAYFVETVNLAQKRSIALVEFIIDKTKLYERVKNSLNERQEKLLERMFREGPDGFQGGLNVKNYISITSTSRATATRDLQDLVEKGALYKTGELKGTRYYLKLGNG